MNPSDIKFGDVMQLNPETVGNKAFAACMFIVTEPKAFGAQGYVQALGQSREVGGGQAYYRAKWEEMEPTGGTAQWVPSDEQGETP